MVAPVLATAVGVHSWGVSGVSVEPHDLGIIRIGSAAVDAGDKSPTYAWTSVLDTGTRTVYIAVESEHTDDPEELRQLRTKLDAAVAEVLGEIVYPGTKTRTITLPEAAEFRGAITIRKCDDGPPITIVEPGATEGEA